MEALWMKDANKCVTPPFTLRGFERGLELPPRAFLSTVKLNHQLQRFDPVARMEACAGQVSRHLGIGVYLIGV